MKAHFSKLNSKKKLEAEKWMEEIEEAAKHNLLNDNSIEFRQYIESLDGINAEQFQAIRDNYVLRTELTPHNVIKVLETMYTKGRPEDVRRVGINIADELFGTKSHVELLYDSYNNFGKTIFKIPKIDRKKLENSTYIRPETLSYRRNVKNLYNSDSVTCCATNFMQELLATGLLEASHDVKIPYEKMYDKIRGEEGAFQKEVIPYYREHFEHEDRGNVEHEHAEFAKIALLFQIADSQNIVLAGKTVIAAVNDFAKFQEQFFNGMVKSVHSLENKHDMIPKDSVLKASRFNPDSVVDANQNKKLTSGMEMPSTLDIDKLPQDKKDGALLQKNVEAKKAKNVSPATKQPELTKNTR